MKMMTPLERYEKQAQLAAGGMGPRGGGGVPATPVAPGMADPFNQGASAPPMINPDDGLNETNPLRRPRPYMGAGPGGMGS